MTGLLVLIVGGALSTGQAADAFAASGSVHIPSPFQPRSTSTRLPAQVPTSQTTARGHLASHAARAVQSDAVGAQGNVVLPGRTSVSPSRRHTAQSVPTPHQAVANASLTERPDLENATTRVFQHQDGTFTATVYARPVNERGPQGRWQHLSAQQVQAAASTSSAGAGASSATYLDMNNPGNHSGTGSIQAGFSSTSTTFTTFDAYVQFPSLTYSTSNPGPLQNAFVTSASMTLDDLVSQTDANNSTCALSDIGANPVTDSWSASTLSSASAITTSGTGPSTQASFSGPGTGVGVNCPASGQSVGSPTFISIDMTSVTQDWVHGWLANDGVQIQSLDGSFDEFSDSGSNIPSLTVNYVSSGDGANYAESSYVSPSNNQAGYASVSVANEGSTSWTTSNKYALTYELYQVNGTTSTLVTSPAAAKTPMTTTVGPNQTAVLTPTLPSLNPGSYNICWDMYDGASGQLFSTQGIPTACYGLTVANNPPIIDSFNPANNAIEYSLTPTLSVTAHDPDNYPVGATLQYAFALYQNGNTTALATQNFSNLSYFTVPAGLLQYGQLYFWTAQVTDGMTPSPVSAPDYFTVPSAEQPLITDHLGASPYDTTVNGVNPSVGNYSTVATDAVIPGLPSDGPTGGIVRTYNSLDPRVGNFFGTDWSTVLDMRAAVDTDGTNNVLVTLSDGRQERFAHNSDGSYSAPEGIQAWLVAVSGGFQLTDQARNQYTFTHAATDPVTGQPIYGVTALGTADLHNLLTVSWQTTTVSDGSYSGTYSLPHELTAVGATTPSLVFTWTASLASVSGTSVLLPEVAQVSYTIAHPDAYTPSEPWNYTYASTGQLTSVCGPVTPTKCTTYAYTSGTNSGSHFASMVQDSNPQDYWRLDDAAGATSAADAMVVHEGATNALPTNVTFGATAHLAGSPATTASFNGTSSYLALPNSSIVGQQLSIGLWFKTNRAGLTLFSYQSTMPSSSVTPTFAVPALYVGSDGYLYGQFWDGTASPMKSTIKVDDDTWHYAVLSTVNNTQNMYLDATTVQSRSGSALQNSNLGQYVSVGAGQIGTQWPAVPSSNSAHGWFYGKISDVWVADHPIDQPEVAQEYAGGTTPVVELTGMASPNGNTGIALTFDPVSDRVTTVTTADGGTYTLPAPTTSGTSDYYTGLVAGSRPKYNFPLSETNSAAANNTLGSFAPTQTNAYGTYNSVLLGQPGMFGPNGPAAASFNGTSSYVNFGGSWFDTPSRSFGVWIKTAKAGGTIFGIESSPFGTTPSQFVPILYVGTDGKVHGGVPDDPAGQDAQNGALPVVSQTVVDDNQWHCIMLTVGQDEINNLGSPSQSTDYERLWVDGKLEDNTGVELASGQPGVPYGDYGMPFSQLGAGDSAGFTDSDHATNAGGYFQGQLANFMFWNWNLQLADPDIEPLIFKARGSSAQLSPTTIQNVIDPAGRTSSYEFDPANGDRTVQYTNAAGNSTRYGYDDLGFISSTTDANGNGTVVRHDNLGDVIYKQTCPGVGSCVYSTATYDTSTSPTDYSAGKLLSTVDPYGYGDTNTYQSSNGQLSSVVTPPKNTALTGPSTSYTYTTPATATQDGASGHGDEVATITDGLGNVTTYTYCSGGQIASVTNARGGETTYGYSPDTYGVIHSVTYSDLQKAGQLTSYIYDADNRISAVTGPTTTDAVTGQTHQLVTYYSYDADGNMASVQQSDLNHHDPTRMTTYTYTAADRLASVTDPDGNVTKYNYNTMGQLIGKTTPDGTTWAYLYTPAGQLQTIEITNWTGNGPTPATATTLITQQNSYDPGGRLAQTADAEGRITSYTYYDDNTVASMTTAAGSSDAQSATTFYQYNLDGNLEFIDGPCRQIDPTAVDGCLGFRPRHVRLYDADQEIISAYSDLPYINGFIGPWGEDQQYTYDADGNVTTRSENDGGTFDDDGNPVLNQPATVTNYSYDALNDLTASTLVDGSTNLTTSASYSTQGQEETSTDPDGETSDIIRDERGRVDQVQETDSTESLERSTEFYGLDTFGDVTSSEDALGNITQATYDGDGNLIQSEAPAYNNPASGTAVTAITTNAYNAVGELASSTDPLGQKSSYSYDQLGDTVQTSLPGGRTSTATYDADGEQIGAVDPTGAQTQWTYNSQGEMASATVYDRYPSLTSSVSNYSYDGAGDLVQSQTPAGTTSYTYDPMGNQTSATDPMGLTTSYTYDFPGQIATETHPGGTQTENTYDQAGRLTATKDVDSSGNTATSASYTYDNDGRQLTSTDALGNTTTTSYSSTGLVESVTQPVTSSTNLVSKYTHNAAGAVISYTSPNGNTINYTYNTWDLPQSTIVPSVAGDTATADRATTTGYDADQRPTTITRPGGVQVTNSYDAAGDLLGQTGTGAEATTTSRSFGYDLDGRLTSLSAPTGPQTYTYDDRGLMLTAGGTAFHSSWSYDTSGNMLARTDSAGSAQFTYNADDQLSTQTGPTTGYSATYSYNNAGLPSTIAYGNGDTEALTYNSENQPTNQLYETPAGATAALNASTYDLDGRQTTSVDQYPRPAQRFSDSYSYDDASRLTADAVTVGSGTASTTNYAYDGDGNRTSIGAESLTYNAQDEQTAATTAGTTASFSYTKRGTLSAISEPGISIPETYDAFDQLASVNNAATYSYDGLGRLSTATGAGSYSLQYDGLSNDVTSDGSQTYGRTNTGQLASMTAGSANEMSLTDARGDVLASLDANGVEGYAHYSPTGAVQGTSGVTSDLGYQGGWTDPYSQYVKTGNRWYAGNTGTFTTVDHTGAVRQQDPSNDGAAANPYAYGNDDPVNNNDPSGNDACTDDVDEVQAEEEHQAELEAQEQQEAAQAERQVQQEVAESYAEDRIADEEDAEQARIEDQEIARQQAAADAQVEADEQQLLDEQTDNTYSWDDNGGASDDSGYPDSGADAGGGPEGFGDVLEDLGDDLVGGAEVDDGAGLLEGLAGFLSTGDCADATPSDGTGNETGNAPSAESDLPVNAQNAQDPIANIAADGPTQTLNTEAQIADTPAQATESTTSTENAATNGTEVTPPDVSTPTNSSDASGGDSPTDDPLGDPPNSDECGEADPAQGGVYSLRDPETGEIVRTGRTNNFETRRVQHANDPDLGGLDFNRVFSTDDYATQRGLEQMLFMDNPQADLVNGGFNKIQPLRINNPNYDDYMQAAQDYLNGPEEC